MERTVKRLYAACLISIIATIALSILIVYQSTKVIMLQREIAEVRAEFSVIESREPVIVEKEKRELKTLSLE